PVEQREGRDDERGERRLLRREREGREYVRERRLAEHRCVAHDVNYARDERDDACPHHELSEEVPIDLGIAEQGDASSPEAEEKVAEGDPKASRKDHEQKLIEHRLVQVHL